MRSFYCDWCLLAAGWALANLALLIAFAVWRGWGAWFTFPAFSVGAIAGAVCAVNLRQRWKQEDDTHD